MARRHLEVAGTLATELFPATGVVIWSPWRVRDASVKTPMPSGSRTGHTDAWARVLLEEGFRNGDAGT